MKTIFITVAESSIANNILRGPFGTKIKGAPDLRIVLLVTPEKQQVYKEEFGGGNIVIESLPLAVPNYTERVMAFLAGNCLPTGMIKFKQMRQFKEDGRLFTLCVKRFLWYLPLKRLLTRLLRKLELYIAPAARVKELFDRYHPDLVFCPLVSYAGMDMPVLREAKRRGVKTLGAASRSWDAFVAHGYLRVVPDRLLLVDRYIKECGVRYQFIDVDTMEVVGFPAFDWYWRKDLIEPRDKFLAKLGIDPNKKVILFGAAEYYWYPRDYEIAEIFGEMVDGGMLPDNLVMLFRPYPGFAGPVEKVKDLRHVVPDMRAFSMQWADDLEMREQQVAHLLNSIFHSEMVITTVSTIAIDGMVLGKPAIAAAFEKTKSPYWFSPLRFHDHSTHFMAVMATGGIRKVDSKEKLAEAIKMYLANPLADQEKRKKLTGLFIEPNDGKAGERTAEAILKLL